MLSQLKQEYNNKLQMQKQEKQLTDEVLTGYLKNFISITGYKKISQGAELLAYLEKQKNESKVQKVVKMIYYFYDNVKNQGKLCALQFIKEVMELGQVKVFLVWQKCLMKDFSSIIEYRCYVKNILRGSTYFIKQMNKNQQESKVAELIKISNSYCRMAHEILYIWGCEYFKDSGFGQLYRKLSKYCTFPEYPNDFKFYQVEKVELSKKKEGFKIINQYLKNRKQSNHIPNELSQKSDTIKISKSQTRPQSNVQPPSSQIKKKKSHEATQLIIQQIQNTNILEQQQQQNVLSLYTHQSKIVLKSQKSKIKYPSVVYRESAIEDPYDAQLPEQSKIPAHFSTKDNRYIELPMSIIQEKNTQQAIVSKNTPSGEKIGETQSYRDIGMIQSYKDKQLPKTIDIRSQNFKKTKQQNQPQIDIIQSPHSVPLIKMESNTPVSSQRLAYGYECSESEPSADKIKINKKSSSQEEKKKIQQIEAVGSPEDNYGAVEEKQKDTQGKKKVPKLALKEVKIRKKQKKNQINQSPTKPLTQNQPQPKQAEKQKTFAIQKQQQPYKINGEQNKLQAIPLIPLILTTDKIKQANEKELNVDKQQHVKKSLTRSIQYDEIRSSSIPSGTRTKIIVSSIFQQNQQQINSKYGCKSAIYNENQAIQSQKQKKIVKTFKRKKKLHVKLFDEQDNIKSEIQNSGISESKPKTERKVIASNLYSIKQLCRGGHQGQNFQLQKMKMTQSKLKRFREIEITLIPNPSKKIFSKEDQVQQAQKRQIVKIKKQIGEELKDIESKLENKNKEMVDSIKSILQQHTSKLLIPLKDLNSPPYKKQQLSLKNGKHRKSQLQNESKMEMKRKSSEKRSSLSQLKAKEEYECGTMLYQMVRRKSLFV